MSDEESTQEIEIDALRDSLAKARDESAGQRGSSPDGPHSDRETTRASRPSSSQQPQQGGGARGAEPHAGDIDDRTVMTPPRKRGSRKKEKRERDAPSSITRVDAAEASGGGAPPLAPEAIEPIDMFDDPPPQEPMDSIAMDVITDPLLRRPSHHDENDNVDLADVNDIVSDDSAAADDGTDDLAPAPNDPAPSLMGTLPGYEVAQALRAMMGEVPDTYERAYQEPEVMASHLDNATPFVVPTGYRRERPDDTHSSLPAAPRPTIDDAAAHVHNEDQHGDDNSDIDPSLDEGDTQTRLPGDPPGGAGPATMAMPDVLGDENVAREMDREGRDEDALPAFALDEDPESQSHWATATPHPPTAPPNKNAWGHETLTSSSAPSTAAAKSSVSSSRSNPPPTTRHGADAPDHTAITRAAPAEAAKRAFESFGGHESTAITRGVGGLPTPSVPWEVAKAVAAETTAVFKGPVPSMALPSMREPPRGAGFVHDDEEDEAAANAATNENLSAIAASVLSANANANANAGASASANATANVTSAENEVTNAGLDLLDQAAAAAAAAGSPSAFLTGTGLEEEDDDAIRLRSPRANWDPNEPSSNFPVAKNLRQSSPNFAPVDSSELETIDPSAMAPPFRAAFPLPPTPTAPPVTAFESVDDALDSLEAGGELPRFTLASIPEMSVEGRAPEIATPDLLLDDEQQTALPLTPPVVSSIEPLTPAVMPAAEPISPASTSDSGSTATAIRSSMPSVDIRISSPGLDSSSGEHQHSANEHALAHADPHMGGGGTLELPSAQEEPTSAGTSAPSIDLALEAGLGHPAPLEEAEIEEILEPEEILEDDDPRLHDHHNNDATAIAAAPVHATSNLTSRPPPPLSVPPSGPASISFRPQPVAKTTPPAPEQPDVEEQELIAEGRWGPLIALYRQRLADTDGPNKKAAILIRIANVYESGLEDLNEAYTSLVDAFELAPANEEVVTQIDRIGKATQRMGELADHVKKRLLPGAPDDKRVTYLGHLVYWYERVLSRGSEVSSFVSEIERHDRVHPVVLKRAAQIAAMNGDTKTQREHLLRALERTSRREEKVQLHLALASAFAGTSDALKHYEIALQLEPTSIVALQGLKRLGKEKEQYEQIQWALERQAEVAPTESEKIDALLELAELQESKFLKREAAADLYERVLLIEPAQPTALKALERCYHALRDWPKLSRILAVRAEHTFEKKQKVELFELAAEVHESKLGDPAGAVEAYINLLVVEPKHRRALSDLARLYEKLSDWANVATYKARLAELAPTKRLSSQELVKLGDFLNQPDRDPIAAKMQYEKATTIDPTNPGAWEAIQRIAAAEGDIHRVIDCLEQRKNHTDVPRQRAVVLVELATVHQSQSDEESAKECFEAAIRADSSNETAAVAMLDVYTAEERWAEAAPLCELLVNAAIRDRDGEALFVRLRLATRIAAALGDAERSITSAVAALDARPKDIGAQSDLIAVCSQSPGSIERVRPHIMLVAENAEGLSADLLVRLAGLQRELNELDGAATTLEQARKLEPNAMDITKELSDVYLQQADFPRACKLKIDMARNAEVAEIRFDLLVEAGEIWARRADELEKAASIFEEARGLKPLDPWLLQTLSWLYGELEEWGLLTGVLEDLAQVTEAPQEKMKHLMTMAEVVRDRVGDRVRSADLLDQVLDLDKKRLDIFEELVRTLTEEKNWERLERSYRKMIARVKDDDEPQLQFLLFHQLGLIYRDRLGDASRAYDALDAASRLQPENAEVRKIVTELLVVTDNLDNAVSRIRDDIDRDPHDAQLYAELYELFLRQHFFDKAWCAVNVLARLREPSPEQRRFHEDYAPMPLDRVPGQIVEQAWQSHVFHSDLEVSLTALFGVMTPAVARMRFAQLRPEQRVGRPFTPTHSRMHDAIRLAFNNASEILAVSPPELLLGDAKAVTPFAPALAPFGAILISAAAVEAQADSLVYMVGKRLAEQRPELSARAFLTVPDLTSLLATAIRVSRQEVAKDPSAAALDASFSAILTPQEREAIRKIVLNAAGAGLDGGFDVKRWSQAADLSSMRAGLLLSGDVEPTRNAINAEIVAPQDLTPREKVGELFKFATSDLYSDLRGAIGVAVQS